MTDADSIDRTPAAAADASTAERPAFDARDLLARLWVQNLPLMRHRIESLEAAAVQIALGDLAAGARTGASDIAHKLAGSLGMFGFPTGTEIARQMEAMLEGERPMDAAEFSRLTADLRAALPL